jgi:hypothetical protein
MTQPTDAKVPQKQFAPLGDPGAEPPVGRADHLAADIDRVALVSTGEQPGAAGDGTGVGIERDRSGLGGGDAQAEDRQEQEARRADQECGDVDFEAGNQAFFF